MKLDENIYKSEKLAIVNPTSKESKRTISRNEEEGPNLTFKADSPHYLKGSTLKHMSFKSKKSIMSMNSRPTRKNETGKKSTLREMMISEKVRKVKKV